MSREEIRRQVLAALAEVAPEVDPAMLVEDRPLRAQVDIDSYDILRFLVKLHERLGVDIPERDYGAIDTPARLVDYLVERTPRSGGAG